MPLWPSQKPLLEARTERINALTTDQDVRDAASAVVAALTPAVGGDWTAKVPHLTWSIAETVAHTVDCVLWYSVDLAAAGPDLQIIELSTRSAAPAADLLAAVTGASRLLASVVSAAPPEARGFHPWGSADRSGFAAIGCDELLVHGWDAAQALGVEFRPESKLAGRVLGRIFPWVAAEPDEWTALLWANGRLDLPSRPRPTRWRWHCAPLHEWDGSVPS